VAGGRFNFFDAFKNRWYHALLSPFQSPVNGGVLTTMERFDFKNPKYDTELGEVLVK
jgi:hypothetical protein